MSEALPGMPAGAEAAAAVRLVVFDFDGVFTDNTVWTDDQGRESVRCWRSDGLGLKKLRELGIPAWVLSTEENPVVARRCEKLKLPCRHGLARKEDALRDLAAELGIPLAEVLFVGNDINDEGCLRIAGTPVVVSDAYPEVVPLAKFRTRTPGGFGAVREVCDWLHSARAAVGRK